MIDCGHIFCVTFIVLELAYISSMYLSGIHLQILYQYYRVIFHTVCVSIGVCVCVACSGSFPPGARPLLLQI